MKDWDSVKLWFDYEKGSAASGVSHKRLWNISENGDSVLFLLYQRTRTDCKVLLLSNYKITGKTQKSHKCVN